MSRPERWWRPSTRRRPPLRARQRRMYTEQEMGAVFDTAYQCGKGDEAQRARDRDDMLHRLAEACNDGPDAVTALAREVGVMPLDSSLQGGIQADAEQLADEVERWLRERES